jgi:hypothetical protein
LSSAKVQTTSGAHPASFLMGTKDYFPWGKIAWEWRWLSPPSSAEVRMSGAIPLFPLYMWLGKEQLLPFMISGTYTEETNPTFTYQSSPANV